MNREKNAQPRVGYVACRAGGRSWLQPEPTTSPYVRAAFGMISAKTMSLAKLADTAGQWGLVSRRGLPLSRTALLRMLTDRFYLGEVRRGESWVPGQHEGLVSPEVFAAAQDALASRRKCGF